MIRLQGQQRVNVFNQEFVLYINWQTFFGSGSVLPAVDKVDDDDRGKTT